MVEINSEFQEGVNKMQKIEQKDILETVKKLSALVFVNPTGLERKATDEEIAKMLALCQKRNNPSYRTL